MHIGSILKNRDSAQAELYPRFNTSFGNVKTFFFSANLFKVFKVL